ncbi:hypothetical protein MRB53_036582 [Persea americana]|nr:hypothetical protein MRB53_036760 [Persea americana]KAJ8614384.1 hypothetical protein MRB53_036582 [Persea americana]
MDCFTSRARGVLSQRGPAAQAHWALVPQTASALEAKHAITPPFRQTNDNNSTVPAQADRRIGTPLTLRPYGAKKLISLLARFPHASLRTERSTRAVI